MRKVITPMTIDEGVKFEAKEKGLNMSRIAENALKEALEMKDEEKIDTPKCFKCNKIGHPEAAKGIKAVVNIKDEVINPNSLVWLCPDEKWICNKCLRSYVRHTTVSTKAR